MSWAGSAKRAEDQARERRNALTTRAREMYELAHLQLDETYMERHTEATRQRYALVSIASSLEALVALKLREVVE